MDAQQAKDLRAPFPASAIGKLPKGGTQLDYVGHAATTARLLEVDPDWQWEPFAVDEQGLPAIDKAGNLWIRLTICGVTRPGCGDGKNMKERIGDAIRNAAMRFGVALDLWAKEDLHEISSGTVPDDNAAEAPAPATEQATRRMSRKPAPDKQMSDEQRARMFALFNERGISDRDAQLAGIFRVIGRPIESRGDLTSAECTKVMDSLKPSEPEPMFDGDPA